MKHCQRGQHPQARQQYQAPSGPVSPGRMSAPMQAAILAADAFKASGAGCSCRATFRSGAPPGGQLAVGTVTPGAGGANDIQSLGPGRELAQFHRSTRFQPPSLKCRTSGFPTVRLQATGTFAVRYGAFRRSSEVKADPAMPPVGYCVCSALRRCHPPIDPPPLCAETSAAPSPPVPRGPRSGRAVLSRPSMLGDLIRQSGELPAISRLRRL